ncbi:hypothetical protein Q427_22450 [Halomonas sp. BC04]|nr:hypothetical protein Q427_22450 [Halomonas sp. BC04]
MEKAAVGALVPIATGAGRRPAETETLVMAANAGNSAEEACGLQS